MSKTFHIRPGSIVIDQNTGAIQRVIAKRDEEQTLHIYREYIEGFKKSEIEVRVYINLETDDDKAILKTLKNGEFFKFFKEVDHFVITFHLSAPKYDQIEIDTSGIEDYNKGKSLTILSNYHLVVNFIKSWNSSSVNKQHKLKLLDLNLVNISLYSEILILARHIRLKSSNLTDIDFQDNVTDVFCYTSIIFQDQSLLLNCSGSIRTIQTHGPDNEICSPELRVQNISIYSLYREPIPYIRINVDYQEGQIIGYLHHSQSHRSELINFLTRLKMRLLRSLNMKGDIEAKISIITYKPFDSYYIDTRDVDNTAKIMPKTAREIINKHKTSYYNNSPKDFESV